MYHNFMLIPQINVRENFLKNQLDKRFRLEEYKTGIIAHMENLK